MRRWIPRTILVVGAVAVLVLGAAANGFEPSLAHSPTSTSTEQPPTEPAPQTTGPALRISVRKLLVDPSDNSTAVVVRIANPSPRSAITDAPITIELLDRVRNVVGTSAVAGTDGLLVHVPYVRPGESALFVNDTIAPSAAPFGARATGTAIFSTVQRVRLAVRTPRLLPTGPFGFSRAVGTLVSSDSPRTRSVLVQAVVQRGGDIVAAGTTVLVVPPRGRATPFEIDLVGDANGGELRLWAPPQ